MSSASLALRRHLYALAVGTTAGATVGLVGWGGAQIIIPSMTLNHSVAGLSQLAATGISLTSLSLSTASSGWKYWREGSVDASLAASIGVPAALSARCGTRIARRMSGPALALVFEGLSMILIPTHYWIQHRAESRMGSLLVGEAAQGVSFAQMDSQKRQGDSALAGMSVPFPQTFPIPTTVAGAPVLQHASFGLLSGIVSALMGVGGLPLTVSYITEAAHLPHHQVQGTAICAVIPAVIMSSLSRLTVVPPVTAALVATGAAAGGYVGARGALCLSEDALRHLYMGSLVLFGSRAVIGAGRNLYRICSGKS